MKKVVFVHRVTCDYSYSFLVKLHASLQANGVDFLVVSGSPWKNEGLIDVLDKLPFGIRCENRLIGHRLFWARNVLEVTENADLVIFEQLNSSLHLYPHILRRWFDILLKKFFHISRSRKLAFWGHGATLNERNPNKFPKLWKNILARQVDWWFTYTEISKNIVKGTGFPNDRITVFQNTIDTKALSYAMYQLDQHDGLFLKEELFGECLSAKELDPKSRVAIGVFCARLVPMKWIPFLLQSLDFIKESYKNFFMIIIGDGPDAETIKMFSTKRPWCVWVGSQHGVDRVKYLALGDVWLNPGAIGLAIIDAMTIGLPMITTDNGIHGPEICYLLHGQNGLMTLPDPKLYADNIVKLLLHEKELIRMKNNSLREGEKYSIDVMVERFEQGVLNCLND